MATRSGLLAEACLALLLLPILRGLTITRLLGIHFEASVRYHIWLATSMIVFAALHGGGTLFIWGEKKHISDEVYLVPSAILILQSTETKIFILLIIANTDMEVAEKRENIPCWRDCFCYSTCNLDNITSASEKKAI